MMRTLVSMLIAALSIGLNACSEKSAAESDGDSSSKPGSQGPGGAKGTTGGGFLLAQVVFKGTEPQPARLRIVRPDGDGWTQEVIDDEGGGNVFHKALCFTPVSGKPGILTISANDPFIKIWRRNGDGWTPETIWKEDPANPIGDKQHRLREVEIGDVTGDGVDDIVLVTHDLGIIFLLEQKDGAYVETRVTAPTAATWIHECELMDIDGDGVLEIFATPSKENNMSGKDQPGFIKMYDLVDGTWTETVIDEFTTRHAKEILAFDYYGDGKPLLFTCIEGERIGAAGGASSAIKMYRWTEEGVQGEEIISLPGSMCRFLVCGDTNGNGKNELIAATRKYGIIAVHDEGGDEGWKPKNIASSLVSSSFEHAIALHDLDGDGVLEIIAASDDQYRLQAFRWDADRARYQRKSLLKIGEEKAMTFNMNEYSLED